MDRPRNHKNSQFRETVFRNGSITERELTQEQVAKLNPQDVDFHFNEAAGEASIRKEDGKYISYSGEVPRIGDKSERLLTEMMWQPGLLLLPRQVAAVLGRSQTYQQDEFENSLSAMLSRLRRTFGENAARPWYFRTRRRPFSFGWCEKRSWRIIERIAQST